jgi:parvulin-like peptidyl-prolyl isomerase
MSKASKVKVPKEMTRKHLARAEREARQRRWLLIGVVGVLVLVIGLVGYAFLDTRVLRFQQPVATVSGKNITTADFQKRVRFTRGQINTQINQLQVQRQQFAGDETLGFITQQIDQQINDLQSQLDSPSALGKRVLDNMIEEELVRQEAARRNITVTPDEVQTAIEHDFNYYRIPPTATPVPTASPTPLVSPTPKPTATVSITPTETPEPTETPMPTATPVTEQAFNDAFSKYLSQIAPTGMTQQDLDKLVEANLLRNKLQEAFNKDVPTSGDQAQFRYIVFDTIDKAQEAEVQLKSGTSFDDLFNRAEAGQVISATAGSQPWMLTSDMPDQYNKNLADVVLSLGISQTSQIITGTFGPSALIVQQTGRGVRSLDASQLQTEQQKAYQTWLDNQRNGPGVNLYNNRYIDRVPTS